LNKKEEPLGKSTVGRKGAQQRKEKNTQSTTSERTVPDWEKKGQFISRKGGANEKRGAKNNNHGDEEKYR